LRSASYQSVFGISRFTVQVNGAFGRVGRFRIKLAGTGNIWKMRSVALDVAVEFSAVVFACDQ